MTRGEQRQNEGGRTHSFGRRLRAGVIGGMFIGGAICLGSAASSVTASAHVIPSGGVKVSCADSNVVVNVTNWSGNVEIVGNGNTVDRAPVFTSPGAGSATFTLAEIGGNGNYTAGRQNNPTDPVPVHFTVECNTPDLSTKLSSSAILNTATVTDQATLSGQDSDDTGTVTYNVYSGSGSSACTGTPVQHSTKTLSNGTIPASDAFTLAAGSYEVQAVYSGDSENDDAMSPCGSEPLSVQNQPAVTTALSASSLTLPANTVTDQATLSGATNDAGGSVTYNLYTGTGNAACVPANLVQHNSKTVVNGKAPVSDSFTVGVGHFEAQAVYSGDAKNKGAMSACGSEPLAVNAGGAGGVQAITTPATGASDSLTGITVGGFLLLGGMGVALAGLFVPRRRRSNAR